MTTVTFQSHCCAVICLPEYAPVCIPASVCCKKKKKKKEITLTVVSQREPWALELRRRGCTGSQKAVLFSTDVCTTPPPPTSALPFSLWNTCTHTHAHKPPAVRSPGGSEAHWLIRSQVKRCPQACYNAKVNDKTLSFAHTRLHLWPTGSFCSTCTHKYRLTDPCTSTVSIRQLLA